MKYILNRMTLLVLLMATAMAAQGTIITAEEALERLKEIDGPEWIREGTDRMQLAKTFEDRYDGKYAYAFTGPDGFVLASASDATPALLGYGRDFDPADIPSLMYTMLTGYFHQITWFERYARFDGSVVEDRPLIDPMVTTSWGCRSPYNYYCPFNADTGSLATAVAQVVNYHEWPQGPGTGIFKYISNGVEHYFDYGRHSFDWSLMRDSYSSAEVIDQECRAVARLMQACAIGTETIFWVEGSVGLSEAVTRLLNENLGYDKSAAYRFRGHYLEPEWDEVIYDDLAAGNPVLLLNKWGDGAVCDGYAGNGLYHVNWGLEGRFDGYFLLSALYPFNYEVDAGFSYFATYKYQDPSGLIAITGIRPSTGTDDDAFIPLYSDDFVWNQDKCEYMFKEPAKLHSEQSFEITTGLWLEDGDGVSYYAGDNTMRVNNSSEIKTLSVDYPSDMPPGRYRAYPASRLAGTDRWQKINIKNKTPLWVTKTAGGQIIHDGKLEDYSKMYLVLDDAVADWPYKMSPFIDKTGSLYYQITINMPAYHKRIMFITPNKDLSFGSCKGFHELFSGSDFTSAGGIEEVELSQYGLWMYFPEAWPGGKVDVRLRLDDMKVTFEWEESGLASIEEVDAPDGTSPYYNLQGQPVASPGSGIYIRVTDGVATKIRIP